MANIQTFYNVSSRSVFDRQLAEGNVPSTAIAFVKDTREIWAQGVFYPSDFSAGVLSYAPTGSTLTYTDGLGYERDFRIGQACVYASNASEDGYGIAFLKGVEDGIAVWQELGSIIMKAEEALNVANEAKDAVDVLARTKAGAFHVESDTGLFIVFTTEEAKSAYLTSGDESGVIGKFVLGGAETETVYSMEVNIAKEVYNFTTSSEKMEVTAAYSSKVKRNDEEGYVDFNEAAIFTVSVIKSGADMQVVSSGNIVKQGETFTFDVKPYVGNGDNTIIITAEGLVSASKGVQTTTVSVTSMALLPMNFEWNKPFVQGTSYSLGGMQILGTLDKILHIVVSGDDYYQTYDVNIGTAQYSEIAYTFDELVHPEVTGVYKVELWLEATESGLVSESLVYRIMCIASADVNTAQLICINDVATQAMNYAENKLFSYSVYNAGTSTATPSIAIHKDSDIIASNTYTVSTSVIHDYSYSFALSLSESTASIGVFATFGNEQAAIITLVNEASLAPVSGYSFYMDAATRSNGDENKESIINEATQINVAATWKDMAWVNGMDGWTTDSDGNKCLVIPAMSSAEVDITPMKNVSTVSIEMLYKVANVSDFNEDIITIASESASSWIGMRIKPTNITLHSQSLFTEDLKQGYNTKDEELVHLVVTIVSNYSGIGNVAMIYVNGVKKCSFEWAVGDTFAHNGTLKLGSQTADLYLYKMRVYSFAFSWQQVMQNYIASIMSQEDKAKFKRKEDTVLNDANEIDYDKVYGVYNTMVVELPKGASLPNRKNNPSNEAIEGTNLYINIIQDLMCSIQGDWLNIPLEGQGTTAMTYYRWNLRSKTSSTYGKFRITAKKNVASSMHSHKMGATRLYNDLNQAIVGANEADGRVAVYQYPVYGFLKIEKEDAPGTYYYEFIGLYTVGPDKGDKSTFGYDNEDYESTLIHMEGTDHSPKGVGMEYPWEQMTVGINKDGDAFIGAMDADGGLAEEAWEIGACGDKEEAADMKAYMDTEFAPAYNLDYECTPMIVGLESGTTIDSVNADVKTFRSQTADNGFSYGDCLVYIDGEYDIYYFNIVSQTYVKDGRKVYKGLEDYGFSLTDLEAKTTVLEKTNYIREYRKARHKAEVSNYWNLDDSLFHACFLELVGATDNEKKNSYPYKFGTLASGSRWRWRQDDLDTIFDVNNQGAADKKYSIINTDSMNGVMIFKGNTSYHWRCIRDYYKDELKAMMQTIMSTMVSLCPSGYGTSQIQKLVGCIKKYFWDFAQEYFTGGAYNIDAKWTYEDTWALYQSDKTINAVHPLQQSLGSHYEAEVSWVTMRMLFLASMYEYGAFVNYVDSSEGQVSFRQGGDFTFSLVPAIDMRPSVIQGSNSKIIHSEGRVMSGDSVDISMPTDTSADTMVYIQGADWLTDVGDFSKVQIGSSDKTFSITSKRVQKIKVGDETASEVTTNIGKLDVGYCPSVVEVEARNVSALSENVDLTKCPRLRRAYFGGTSVTAITLPDGSKIEEYDLPSSLVRLTLKKLPLLTAEGLTYENLNTLSYLWVEDNTSIEGYELLKTALEGGSPLNNIRVIGFEKVGDSTDYNFIMQLTDGNYHGIDAEGNNLDESYPVIEGHLHIAGNLNQESVDFLNTKFPALVLTADQIIEYFKFADAEVSRIVAENWGDGTGTTLEQIEAVTSIGTVFKGNTTIETFDEFEKFTGVTTLKESAFENCTSLLLIDLRNITSIERYSFRNCSALAIDVYAPKLTGALYYGTFTNSGITAIKDLGSITKITSYDYSTGAFRNCTNLVSVVLPNTLTDIGSYAFNYDSKLNQINIPESVISIGDSAFSNCTSLEIEDLSLPNLETLGQNAFYGVSIKKISNLGKITALPTASSSTQNFGDKSVLEEVVLPDTIENIPSYSFLNCSSLTKCYIPQTLVSMGESVFRNSANLSGDIFLPNLTSMNHYVFTNTSIESFSANSLTELIGVDNTIGGPFSNCKSLKSVEISSATSIGPRVFYGCVNLESIKCELVESINTFAFYNCTALKVDLILPSLITLGIGAFIMSGVKSIIAKGLETIKGVNSTSRGAFESCNDLTFVELEAISNIGPRAFYGCKNLQRIIINNTTPPTLESVNALTNTNNCPIYVPDESVEAYKTATNWSDYADRIKPLSEYTE